MADINENWFFRKAVRFLNAILNAGCVSNVQVAADADIDASKLEHAHRVKLAQESDEAVVAETRPIHVVKGATATLKSVAAGLVVPCASGETIEIDILKNGVTLMSAAIELDSADDAYDVVAGTIQDEDLVADDVLEIEITPLAGSAGADAMGIFCYLDIWEDAEVGA